MLLQENNPLQGGNSMLLYYTPHSGLFSYNSTPCPVLFLTQFIQLHQLYCSIGLVNSPLYILTLLWKIE